MTSEVYLLDSSIWVTVLRRNPPDLVVRRFNELMASGRVAINEIVRLEVLMGYRTEAELNRVDDRLTGMPFLGMTDSVWGLAARLHALLRKNGMTRSVPDLLIATTAIVHKAVLVHQDSDFDRIAQHSDLLVESFVGVA